MRFMGKRSITLVVAALLAVTLLPATVSVATTANVQVDYPDEIVIVDGKTAPVFGYADAIRQRVWVEADFDTDSNGELDRIAMDIIRPAATADGLKVPVVMDPSPYYTTLCRGNESQCIEDVDGDGINDRWPLFYDNYFVPRGYAVVLLHMVGTGLSSGCPVTGGTADNLSPVVAIDWLNGRRPGVDAAGNPVVADWHNGKSAAIGKSYDGTLANSAAATGVEGLTTIVPISAISSWYDYTRSNGILTRSNYLGSLSNTVTNPDRRAHCAPVRTQLNAIADDASGNYGPQWRERDYNPDVDKVTASVFAIHGMQDDNVRPDHFSKWWYGLAANDVPRKVWINRSGHEEAFDFPGRRALWVDTLHRWFDYWLQDIDNGIMDEPMADVELGPENWVQYETWPHPKADMTGLSFTPTGDGTAGGLSLTRVGDTRTGPVELSWVDRSNQTENQMLNNPTTANPNRLVFLSDPLTAPLHISGTPEVQLRARVNAEFTNFGAILVEYSPAPLTQMSRTSEGVVNQSGNPRDCWGESSAIDSACYIMTQTSLTTATQWRVTKGIVDGRNVDDYSTDTLLVPDGWNEFRFPLLPVDYEFKAGSRIGVIVVGSYSGYSAATVNNAAQITIDLRESNIRLPIIDGRRGALDAGIASGRS